MNDRLRPLLRERILILDGAMGTMLQERGLMPGECPELMNLSSPQVVVDIHRQYVEAGADIIETNTFGANAYKLAEYGLADRVREINAAGVKAAREAAGSRALVAASVGPTGHLLRPMGDVDFDDLYRVFYEQIRAVADAGADIVCLETMTDIGELRAAVIAAREACDLPVLAHLTFEADGRTMMGTDPVTAAVILEPLGPVAIGANCSGGAAELLPIIEQMGRFTNCFISVEPNAGLPSLVEGKTVFPASPDEMAAWALRLRDAGANIIGGCCGTTPAHIREIARAVGSLTPARRPSVSRRALASRNKVVFVDEGNLKFIGERINPTARKKLAQDIREGRMALVVEEAKKQVAAGAPVLDVNMGVPGIDEVAAMTAAVDLIQSAVTVPLSIDTTNAQALEAGLKAFVGRALINSTTGEETSLEKVLPLAKKYGAAVLGLCLDESGIPDSAEGRMKIARRIYEKAKAAGLRDEDIYLDGLVKTASAEQAQVMETLKTVRAIKEELGVGTVLGVSNVSHGLPAREILNATYLGMAWAAGLDLPIMNPFDERMQEVTRAAAVLMARDQDAALYISTYKGTVPAPSTGRGRSPICERCNIPELLQDKSPASVSSGKEEGNASAPAVTPDLDALYQAVLEGNQQEIVGLVKAEVERGRKPMDIVDTSLIPAIEEVGRRYDSREYFLPQLMRSADTMKAAFGYLKPLLAESGREVVGTVVLATVKGDIHDIGKNIVAVMLENYGFRVIDLGKDIPADTIVEVAQKENAEIIGLSALMTTTMCQMPEVIKLVRQQGLKSRVMVGGAVLTEEYARQIGADGYAADAQEAVRLARRLLQIV